MISWILSSALITIILLVSTYIAIWSRRPSNARLVAIVLVVPLSLGVLGLTGYVLGNPSRCYAGWNIPEGKLNILGFKIVKNEKIYLLLDTGDKEPYSCSVPYSNSKAETLEGTKRAGGNSKLKTKGSGTPGESVGMPDDGIILPDPVARLPDKLQTNDDHLSL